MWKTALLLIITIAVVAIAGFYFSKPSTELQSTTMKEFGLICLIFTFLCFENYLFNKLKSIYNEKISQQNDLIPQFIQYSNSETKQ